MSLSGKLLRGLGWYNNRSAHAKKEFGEFGELFLPEEVLVSPHKMEEMQFYLDFVAERDAEAVHRVLEQVKLFDLMHKPQRMVLEAQKLVDLKVSVEPKDYDSMTKAQLQDALTAGLVEWDVTATKAELLKLTGGL